MSDIILKVVTVDAAQPAQALARSFDAAGGTIGRDESNDLALPDKHRRVSRLHATISFPEGIPTITNSSTSLPISVGEQQLDFGESMPLHHGALVEVGPYILQAHSVLLDAPPKIIDLVAQPAPRVSALGAHSGMAVVLPHPLVAPSPVTSVPAQAYETPIVQSLATSLPASLSNTTDLSDWLGGGLIPPVAPAAVFSSIISPVAAVAAAPAPAPFYAAAAVYVAPAPTVIPPTPANLDPFADLLDGIGGPPVVHPSPTGGAYPPPLPTAQSLQSANGLSADPLAAFGGFAVDSFGRASGDSATSRLGHDGTSSNRSGGAIPDAFNPFDLPSDTARNQADPLASLLGDSGNNGRTQASQTSETAPSIDSLFQTSTTGGSDASFFGLSSRSGSNGALDSLMGDHSNSDPLSFFEVDASEAAATARAMRNDSQEMASAFQPPKPVQAVPSQPAAQRVTSASSASNFAGFSPPSSPADSRAASLTFDPFAPPPTALAAAAQIGPAAAPTGFTSGAPDVLTEAFLRGAGLTQSALPNGLSPEIMTTIGSLLRSATSGAIDMLAARAATKREVQASVTIISVQANNPLKFLPNADSALLQLLGKKMPGFMRADVAMKDAFDDLRAHEVGVIAGTRAALTEVLGKFDPAALGDKLAKGSVLESLMPSARKAKLWDLYLDRYLQIRREAEDDFQSIFGRAFVQAYELETARVKANTQGSGGERS